MSIREDVLAATKLIADDPDASDQVAVERLIELGYDALRAELLSVFVPLGLARAVIERLDLNPGVKLSDKALIPYSGNRTLEVELSQIPEYQEARRLGEETFRNGIIPRAQLAAISSVSVEMNVINEALSENKQIAGSTLSPPILLRLASTPGFENWYYALESRTKS